jgi:hypothetical protein
MILSSHLLLADSLDPGFTTAAETLVCVSTVPLMVSPFVARHLVSSSASQRGASTQLLESVPCPAVALLSGPTTSRPRFTSRDEPKVIDDEIIFNRLRILGFIGAERRRQRSWSTLLFLLQIFVLVFVPGVRRGRVRGRRRVRFPRASSHYEFGGEVQMRTSRVSSPVFSIPCSHQEGK